MRLDAVRNNDDRLAKRYDRWTELVFGRLLGVDALRERAIDRLGSLEGRVVLDIGCGTGRNFPTLVERVGPRGRVVGVDDSPGMLDVARERVVREGWRNVELRTDDAVVLGSIEPPVDAVVAVWCLGITYDLVGAIHRAIDVLRPGGPMAILDFDRARPDHGWLRRCYPLYSRLLHWSGIDSAEDVDDARLRAKWARGRAAFDGRMVGVTEERYLDGAGVLVAGRVPASAPRACRSLGLRTRPRPR